MTTCPSPDTLLSMIRGQLDPSISSGLRDHLECCDECLVVMDRLTDDPELNQWMADGGDVVRRVAVEGLGSIAVTEASAPSPLGSFTLEAEIGRGGMGVVYRALDLLIGRTVAVKFIRPERVDDRSRARFIREVRAAARVEHDHIVRVYATSEPGDPTPYFVMEYLAGPNLAALIRDRGRLDPREAARLIVQAADGLAAAHAAGLVHQDVKPANILIDGSSGRAKIGDFGLAFSASDAVRSTSVGVIAGTPAYLSPEQARGDTRADARTDVYSLGVTLYECLAGECPFRGSSHRILQQVLNDDPRPPRATNESVPRDLETICLKALAKEPGRRYQGAAEFADDLRRWLAGEPIHARPIGPIGKTWRLARRHPRVATLSAAFVLAIASGVAGIAWQWRRSEANAREARGYLRQTIAAVDAFFIKVSENRLLDVPNLQPLRKELLASARDYYEPLLLQRPYDPTIRVEQAKARVSLGLVVLGIGSTDEAIGHFRQSLAEFDRIITDSPRDLAARFSRLTCLINMGKSQMFGAKLDDAQATYRRLLSEGEAIRRDRPEAVEPLQAIYAALHGLASVSQTRNIDPDGVIGDYERAIEINRELLRRKPESAVYLRNLSRTYGLLNDAYNRRGRAEDARAAFDQSYQSALRLVTEHPESQDYRFALANLERQRGLTPLVNSFMLKGTAAMAELDRAGLAFDRALSLDRELVRENPRVDAYRIDFLGLFAYRAAVELSAGRSRDGLALLHEAGKLVASVENPGSNTAWLARARLDIAVLTAFALSDEGRADEALKSLDQADRVFAALTPADRTVTAAVEGQALRLAFVRGVVLRESGRLSEAVASSARLVDLAPPPARPLVAFLSELYRAEASLGPEPDTRRALAVAPMVDADSASEILPGATHVIYAKIYALAARAVSEPPGRESLAARSILRLEKAGDAGYFRVIKRLDRIESDPAFSHLLDRPDYKTFRQSREKDQTPSTRK